jgi:hypothetical protein
MATVTRPVRVDVDHATAGCGVDRVTEKIRKHFPQGELLAMEKSACALTNNRYAGGLSPITQAVACVSDEAIDVDDGR